MESIYPKLALCGSTNKCARTDTISFLLYEVSKARLSLVKGLFIYDVIQKLDRFSLVNNRPSIDLRDALHMIGDRWEEVNLL